MLYWAFIFLIISMGAGILGFTTLAEKTGTIARVLFTICLTLFITGIIIIVLLII